MYGRRADKRPTLRQQMSGTALAAICKRQHVPSAKI